MGKKMKVIFFHPSNAENSLNKIVTVYTNETKTEEVVDGVITSGMVVETQNASYEVRVVGDLTGNGDCNVTELTRIIREVVGLERLESKREKLSADFNGDGEINVVDITMCIRYIVYGELPADKEEPNAPEIEVRQIVNEDEDGTNNENENKNDNWYNGDVEVRIIEKAREEGEIEKTVITIEKYIEGSSIPKKETTEEKELTLTEEGRYEVKAQSYGTNGLKSEVAQKEINIDKTAPTLSIERKDVDRTQCRIMIQVSDNRGIAKYSVQREGEEERSREGINEKEINGYVTIRENGKYKVIVEDHAGNKVEKEIEINNLNNRYIIIFKNEDGSIISEKNYEQGARTEVPQNPTKQEDNIYTYEFAGWKTTNEQGQEVIVTPEEIASEAVNKNKEYTATYTSTYKNYTVTFKDEDGRGITTKTDYHYGDTVTIPENPVKAEDNTNTYRFIGWDKEVSTVVEGNVEYKAVYEAMWNTKQYMKQQEKNTQ